jgi:hypothetical protein
MTNAFGFYNFKAAEHNLYHKAPCVFPIYLSLSSRFKNINSLA